MADELAAPPEEPPAESPKAEHYGKLVEHYQAMGGVGYKSGLVRSSQAQARKYEPAPPASNETAEPCPETKPVVQAAECTTE